MRQGLAIAVITVAGLFGGDLHHAADLLTVLTSVWLVARAIGVAGVKLYSIGNEVVGEFRWMRMTVAGLLPRVTALEGFMNGGTDQ